jgi:O-Antigen ligase
LLLRYNNEFLLLQLKAIRIVLKISEYFFIVLILALVVLNIPSFFLEYVNSTLSSILSYSIVALFLFLIIVNHKNLSPYGFLIFFLGVIYYIISALNTDESLSIWVKEFIKFSIYAVGSYVVVKKMRESDFIVLLLIGILSVYIDLIFFSSPNSRYSGLYLNPNKAGYLAIIGIFFSFTIKNDVKKYIYLIIFVLGGLITLSRTFMLLLGLVFFLEFINNKRKRLTNIFAIFFVIIGISFFLSLDLELNAERLSFVQGLFEGEVETEVMDRGSRIDTWSLYYDKIRENIFFGSGYKSFQGTTKEFYKLGVHNNFLLILGEGGILTFIYLLLLFSWLAINLKLMDYKLLLLFISFIGYFIVNHNFFIQPFSLLILSYLIVQIETQFYRVKSNI